MTCIIGTIDKKGVYIGGDSAAVSSDDLTYNIRSDVKVFKKDNFIFGYSSSFRMGQILRFKLQIPKQPKGISDFEYMVTHFIDEVKKCFADNNYNDMILDDAGFMVGYKGKLYVIFSDLQIAMPAEEYTALGCGELIALGAMYASSEKNPIKRLEQALEASAKFSMGVKPPFVFETLLNK